METLMFCSLLNTYHSRARAQDFLMEIHDEKTANKNDQLARIKKEVATQLASTQ